MPRMITQGVGARVRRLSGAGRASAARRRRRQRRRARDSDPPVRDRHAIALQASDNVTVSAVDFAYAPTRGTSLSGGHSRLP
jgi:hypothetical protein